MYLVLSNDGAGSTQVEAYKAVYDVAPDTLGDTSINDASGLFRLPHVAARVQELRDRYAEAGQVTVAGVLDKLRTAGKQAITDHQAGAAVGAAMGEAKVGGLLIDRIRDETEQPDAVAAIKELAGDSILAQQGLTLLFAGDVAGYEEFVKGGGVVGNVMGKPRGLPVTH